MREIRFLLWDSSNCEYIHIPRLLYVLMCIGSDVTDLRLNVYTNVIRVVYGNVTIWTNFCIQCKNCTRVDRWSVSDVEEFDTYLKKHAHT